MAIDVDPAQVAEAVTDALNNAPVGTFSRVFAATRVYRTERKLEELGDLLFVDVLPAEVAFETHDRGRDAAEVVVDVGVRQRVASEKPADIDPLAALVKEIVGYMNRRHLTALAPPAKWTRTENRPVFSPEHLKEQRVFLSVVRLRYRIIG